MMVQLDWFRVYEISMLADTTMLCKLETCVRKVISNKAQQSSHIIPFNSACFLPLTKAVQ